MLALWAWLSALLAIGNAQNAGEVCVGQCFSALEGNVDDCCMSFDKVNEINGELQEPLEDLIGRPFFNYYKTNVFKPCPFWHDDGLCGQQSCALKECKPDDLPSVFRNNPHLDSVCEESFSDEVVEAKLHNGDEGLEERLNQMTDHYRQELFWDVADTDEYDDPTSTIKPAWYRLKDNPERFTGYIGDSAAKVWKLIYDENCFLPSVPARNTMELLKHDNVNTMCVEKRAFYRLISGLHTSITTHVCSDFFDSATNTWGPNAEMFYKKFSPDYTWGEGPHRLRNLYFSFLFVLRAIDKAAPYFERYQFFTGNTAEDAHVKAHVARIVRLAERVRAFDESVMFGGDQVTAEQLKMQFRNKFTNISRIMDCVGCTKCRLWGKIQIQGLGTAIKILFTNADMCDGAVCPQERHGLTRELGDIHLRRNEVVSLFQTLEHFSSSIHSLAKLRHMYIPDPKAREKTVVKPKGNPFVL